jgi:hypothetical protein
MRDTSRKKIGRQMQKRQKWKGKTSRKESGREVICTMYIKEREINK